MGLPKKKVQLELVGLDGNAFSLMAAFQAQARRERWTREEIKQVLDECSRSDYDHLLFTLMEVCEPPEGNEGDLGEEGEFGDGEGGDGGAVPA